MTLVKLMYEPGALLLCVEDESDVEVGVKSRRRPTGSDGRCAYRVSVRVSESRVQGMG